MSAGEGSVSVSGACPVCGRRRSLQAIVYGMPEGPVDDPNVRLMGCTIEPSGVASFVCRFCDNLLDQAGRPLGAVAGALRGPGVEGPIHAEELPSNHQGFEQTGDFDADSGLPIVYGGGSLHACPRCYSYTTVEHAEDVDGAWYPVTHHCTTCGMVFHHRTHPAILLKSFRDVMKYLRVDSWASFEDWADDYTDGLMTCLEPEGDPLCVRLR